MAVGTVTSVNVKQAVPFFGVANMEASLRFYIEGLGFKMKHCWIPDRAEDNPDGRIRWCWLELGAAAIMLQEFRPGAQPTETLGNGVNVCFQCEDALALYREFKSRENSAAETSLCGKPSLGGTAHRPRWLPH